MKDILVPDEKIKSFPNMNCERNFSLQGHSRWMLSGVACSVFNKNLYSKYRTNIHMLVLKVTFAKMQRHNIDMGSETSFVPISVISLTLRSATFKLCTSGPGGMEKPGDSRFLLSEQSELHLSQVHIKFPLEKNFTAFKTVRKSVFDHLS